MVEGYAAEGVPQVAVSMDEEEFAFLILSGISGLCGEMSKCWGRKKGLNYTPKPHEHACISHLHCVNPAASLRKTTPEAIRFGLGDDAPTIHRAICFQCASRLERRICLHAARQGVESHLVVVHQVDTLDDIDFPCIWPRPPLSKCPE